MSEKEASARIRINRLESKNLDQTQGIFFDGQIFDACVFATACRTPSPMTAARMATGATA